MLLDRVYNHTWENIPGQLFVSPFFCLFFKLIPEFSTSIKQFVSPHASPRTSSAIGQRTGSPDPTSQPYPLNWTVFRSQPFFFLSCSILVCSV